MATILTFRNKPSGEIDQEFLTDEAEKLSFRMGENGSVSLGDISSASLTPLVSDSRKDWTNQELADLFRVRRLLSGANVEVETMRGITDEGDPWFIFCHFNGDVFIHIARVNSTYILDSPNVRRPLRGADFNGLIADFTNNILPASNVRNKDSEIERRVIWLERGNNIKLHPSAMLAALIWTLFLASEELVALAPEDDTQGSDDLLDFAGLVSNEFELHSFETETTDIASLAMPDAFKDIPSEITQNSTENQMQLREASTGQNGLVLSQNTFSMGLSTIAIAMGFMSEAVLLDNQRKVLDAIKTLSLVQDDGGSATGPEINQITDAQSTVLLDMLAEFLGVDLGLNADVVEAEDRKTNGSMLQDILHAATLLENAEVLLTPVKSMQSVLRKDGNADLTETPQEASNPSTEAEHLLAIEVASKKEPTSLDLSEILTSNQQMKEFQVGQATVKASFDMTETDSISLADFISHTQRTTNHREFNDRAQSFIDYIQSKDTEVGIITVGNEVIMIDRSAFSTAGESTYAFSWETYDGQIISLIGLKAEFQEFDLIA